MFFEFGLTIQRSPLHVTKSLTLVIFMLIVENMPENVILSGNIILER